LAPSRLRSREYEAFKVDFNDNQAIFEEGMSLSVASGKLAMSGFRIREILSIRRRADHAAARPETDPVLCRVILETLDRTRGAPGLRSRRGTLAAR